MARFPLNNGSIGSTVTNVCLLPLCAPKRTGCSREEFRTPLGVRLGTPIPAGVALGPDGQPTTDAVTAHQGALLPFGSLEGGYTGFRLALAMDALGALTAGIRPADAVSGYVFFAFKPDLFLSPDAYRHEVGRRIAAIKATPRQTVTAEIRIPGERSYATRSRLVREGIDIDRKIHDALRRLAEGNLDHGG
jgi:LDH2 family malate/lactate/ureidoglycolate dehydrogenase